MKVLFLIDNLSGGGAERSLHELLPALRNRGVQIVVACFRRREESVEGLLVAENDVRVLGGSRLGQMAALRRIVRDEGVDLVHTSLFKADVFGRPAVAGTKAAVVTSLVNMAYEPARLANDPNVDRVKLWVARGLEAATGRLFADHFHAITEAVKDAAVRRLLIPPDKITVVHRGRDDLRLGGRAPERRARVRRELGLSEDAFVVFNAARQEFQKGQRFLLEAFETFGEKRPNAVLLVAGRQGNASAELERIAARSKHRERIQLLGHRDDVAELMVAADVFALPSLWEGLGCVILEAMGLELPIVASDLPPVREVTADAACLVPPGDAKEIAAALGKLASDPRAASLLARRGRELFEKSFTLERSVEKMLTLYENVRLAKRAGQAARG